MRPFASSNRFKPSHRTPQISRPIPLANRPLSLPAPYADAVRPSASGPVLMQVNAIDAWLRDACVLWRSINGAESGECTTMMSIIRSLIVPDRVRGLDLPRIDGSSSTAQNTEHDEMTSWAPPSLSPHHSQTVFDSSLQSSNPSYLPAAAAPEPSSEGAIGERSYSGEVSDALESPLLDQSDYAANPLPFISGSDRPFSLRNLLNPPSSSRTAYGRSLAETSASDADLIRRGVLSLDIAQQLFSL